MIKPSRRSIRMPDFDYTRPGAYFITVCVRDRDCLFGHVVDGVMRLNELGEIVQQTWDALPNHFSRVELDQFVIMPNHVHGIIVLTDDDRVGATHASPVIVVRDHGRATHASPLHPGPKPQSIGAIVGSFKSAATKRINVLRQTPAHPVWQRNYYEHVIRNDHDLTAIRDYITGNPARWLDDENHPVAGNPVVGARHASPVDCADDYAWATHASPLRDDDEHPEREIAQSRNR